VSSEQSVGMHSHGELPSREGRKKTLSTRGQERRRLGFDTSATPRLSQAVFGPTTSTNEALLRTWSLRSCIDVQLEELEGEPWNRYVQRDEPLITSFPPSLSSCLTSSVQNPPPLPS
jgi:hypothetical protein